MSHWAHLGIKGLYMSRKTDAVLLQPKKMKENIPGPAGERFHIGFLRGELHVELYVPENEDLQEPHTRDECYVIIRGSGKFQMDQDVLSFEAGDFLFVPAGMKHRFFDFGQSLETWVIFYGPEGGANAE